MGMANCDQLVFPKTFKLPEEALKTFINSVDCTKKNKRKGNKGKKRIVRLWLFGNCFDNFR